VKGSRVSKDGDTKMAMLSFCGIDVSKDRLDVVVLPPAHRQAHRTRSAHHLTY
jgi:hypothetical protein